MDDAYVEWKMKSWEDAVRLASQLPENWIFRGQSSHDWRLTTSLERCPKTPLLHENMVKWQSERAMLEAFKSHAHLLLDRLPPSMEDLDWLALLQHHGGVTRLLDFTRSFYVGAFFAVEGAGRDSALWAIDQRHIRRSPMERCEEGHLESQSEESPEEISEGKCDRSMQARLVTNQLLASDSESIGVVPVAPRFHNERLAVQQGLFLFPCGHAVGFEHHLCDSLGLEVHEFPDGGKGVSRNLGEILEMLRQKKPAIIKIRVPSDLRLKILHDLRRMNVTAASLFPGLDGYARSLNFLASGYRLIDQPGALI